MTKTNQNGLQLWLQTASSCGFDEILSETSPLISDHRRGATYEVQQAVSDDASGVARNSIVGHIAQAFQQPVDELLKHSAAYAENLFRLAAVYRCPESFALPLFAIRRDSNAIKLSPMAKGALLDALIENQIDDSLDADWKSIIFSGQSPDGLLVGQSIDGWDGWRLIPRSVCDLDFPVQTALSFASKLSDLMPIASTLRCMTMETDDTKVVSNAQTFDVLSKLATAKFPESFLIRLPCLFASSGGRQIVWHRYAPLIQHIFQAQPLGGIASMGQFLVFETTNRPSIESWIKLLERYRLRCHPNESLHDCLASIRDGVKLLQGFSNRRPSEFMANVLYFVESSLLSFELPVPQELFEKVESCRPSETNVNEQIDAMSTEVQATV